MVQKTNLLLVNLLASLHLSIPKGHPENYMSKYLEYELVQFEEDPRKKGIFLQLCTHKMNERTFQDLQVAVMSVSILKYSFPDPVCK